MWEPSLDTGLLFMIAGIISTILYLLVILLGLKPDLSRYLGSSLDGTGKAFKTLLALGYIGIGFLTLSFIITNRFGEIRELDSIAFFKNLNKKCTLLIPRYTRENPRTYM
ncbi:MAG: hypothetical protein ACFFCS_24165 [Candidatus Hodarchaeota archaeon]